MKKMKFQTLKRIGIFLFFVLLVISGLYLGLKEFTPYLVGLQKYGYLGVFLISLATTSTFLIPAPFTVASVALAVAVASLANPILVTLVYALGSALGEGVGYGIGLTGRKVIIPEQTPAYQRAENLMERYGGWAILVLATVPLVLFDIIGVVAGSLRYPWLNFLFFCFLGRMLRSFVVIFFLSEVFQRFI